MAAEHWKDQPDKEGSPSDLSFLSLLGGQEGAGCLGPIRFELDRLTPMAGLDEEEVVVPVGEEDDVEAMKHSVDPGWHPSPLLVSHRDGQYFLEDGNHRYETLRRNGAAM